MSPGSPAPATAGSPGPAASGTSPIPILAYYYIWFDPSSWQRAKIDAPLGGTYSSDEITVMRRQVTMAKSAGIDGFLVSWKDTSTLSSRLANLVTVAAEQDFKLGIVYQGLDFSRRPLAASKVAQDLKGFAARYATNDVFAIFGAPIVVLTGSGQFSDQELHEIIDPVKDRLLVLASAKSVEEYKATASLFSGNAYYWGAANPAKSWYAPRLADIGQAVRASGGLWIAPAAPGFDARLVGGNSVIDRAGGETLRRELSAALASKPDAIGLISWNEYSENTHVEPSRLYRDQALTVLGELNGSPVVDAGPVDSSAPSTTHSAPRGVNGATAILIMAVALGALFVITRWRRTTPAPAGGRAPGPMPGDAQQDDSGAAARRRGRHL